MRPDDSELFRKHITIEGVGFESHLEVWRHAKLFRGASMSQETMRRRLKQGIRTWDELCKPVSSKRVQTSKSANDARESKREAQRRECQAAMDAVDARRRQIVCTTPRECGLIEAKQ